MFVRNTISFLAVFQVKISFSRVAICGVEILVIAPFLAKTNKRNDTARLVNKQRRVNFSCPRAQNWAVGGRSPLLTKSTLV